MTPEGPEPATCPTTDGTLLGGRLRYRQFSTGYRTGIEPVLLAASVPAKPGDVVLEGGTGAGAALLCLTARVPGVCAIGVERDEAMAGLARHNIGANEAAGASVQTADLLTFAPGQPVDHAISNPPWHDAASPGSGDLLRDAAKRAPPGLLPAWIAALAKPLRPRGSLTLLLPAAILPQALAAMAAAKCGSPAIMPLWPKTGFASRLVLVRGIKLGRGECRLLSGLVLHEGRAFTGAARKILWDGAALDWS